MKRYYSKVNGLSKWTIVGSVILLWGITIPVLTGEINFFFLFMCLFVTAFTVFMASIYFGTYYIIKNDELIWHTGPFKGRVEINEIIEIRKAQW